MDQAWDYGAVDVHLSAILEQYDSLKEQQLQKFQEDVETAKQKCHDEIQSLMTHLKGMANESLLSSLQSDMNSRRDKQCATLYDDFSRSRQELDSERNDVEVLMKKLRARFPNRTPAPFAFGMPPHKVEKDQNPSADTSPDTAASDTHIPQLADSIATELLALPVDTDMADAHANDATTTSTTLTNNGHRVEAPTPDMSIMEDFSQQPNPVAPFIANTTLDDAPPATRPATPPHLHNPPGKRKQPLKVFGQLPSKRAKNRPVHPPGPPLTNRTISFDEVYQGGNATYKHMIVQYDGYNYILKCEEHGVHFKPNAITAAAKHLASSVHGNQKREHQNAVAQLGYLVTDCTPDLIQKHNNLVLNAYYLGYSPLRPKIRYERSVKAMGTGDDHRSVKLAPTLSAKTLSATTDTTNPVAGELYCGRAKPVNPGDKPKRYIVMVLPWKQLPPLTGGIVAETLGQSPLLKQAERKTCYVYDQDGIVDWMPGYEDGGQHVKKRWFPVLWFEKNPPDSFGWLRAGDLTPFVSPGQSTKIPPKSQARALQTRAAAREFLGTAKASLEMLGLDGPVHTPNIPEVTVDGPGNREASPLGSEAMDMDSSSSEDEGPLIETRRPVPEPREEAQVSLQPGLPNIQLGSPIRGETDKTSHVNGDKCANLVTSKDCAAGMAAAALLAQQAIAGSESTASAVPAAKRAALEEAGSAMDGRARSTASPSTGRADSADRSASEPRSAQLTPASSVDRFPMHDPTPASANRTTKQVKGGPSSARNAWQVLAYADGDGEMRQYDHPVKLIGSLDGIARGTVPGGPDIVIYAREVRKIVIDDAKASEGKCTVTMDCGNTKKRLILVSPNGRIQLMSHMFRCWFVKFREHDKSENVRPSSRDRMAQREGAPPPPSHSEGLGQ